MDKQLPKFWSALAVVVLGVSAAGPVVAQGVQPDIKGLLAALPRADGSVFAGGLSCSTDSSLNLTAGRDGVFFSLPVDLRENFALSGETKDLLKRFSNALASHGTTLVALPVPSRGLVQKSSLNGLDARQRNFDPTYAADEFGHLVEDLRSAGIVTADVMASISTENAWSSFYYQRDNYWTTSGAKLAAQAVTAALSDVGRYAELPKARFENTAMATVERKDRLALDIQQLCHRTVPGESDVSYATKQVADTASAPVDAALVGSTFSALPDFNFRGFLEETSGLAFANYAVATSDSIGSLAAMINADRFRTDPPPVAVWEIPPGLNLDLAVFKSFRQIIPSVWGACSGDAIIATSKRVAVNGQVSLLNLSDKQVSGSGYYLHLEASRPGLRGLGIAVTYPKNDADVAVLGSFSGEDNGKDFYFGLADEFDGDAEQVILTGDTSGGTIQLSVCKAPASAL